MGYEHASDGFLRSSVEFRRVKNAKITAMRHRKWQEIRLQREQEEKNAAEEFLKRRRKERARLATYIYSSAQNVDKESHTKLQLSSQEHISKNRTTWEKKRDDLLCRENNRAVQKRSIDKDIIFDICSLPTISVKQNPCDKFLQKHHAGEGQEKSAATPEFLQEALQERLENEAATSLLIAEITDMKSRLDDLLAMPSKGHYEDRKEAGFEHKNIKMSCTSNDLEHDRNNATQLREREVAVDFMKDIHDAKKMKCCMHQNYECFAKENRPANRLKCCMHNDCPDHAVDNYKKKVILHPSSKANTTAVDCEQDSVVIGKLMGLNLQLMPESEGCLLQQQSNGEQISHKERVFSSKTNVSVTGGTDTNNCNNAILSCCDKHEECSILKRLSQESCELEAERNILEEDIHEKTIVAETNARCKVMKENPSRIAKVTLSTSKDKYSDAASNLSPSYKRTPLKQLHSSGVGKDNTTLYLKRRKDSAKLLEFLNAENSLLASLERLDVKLAMASANMSNSSRTSLVSAGHQSTKSAPCVIRQKPGSDAYSINSTMFLSRPTTSQTGGVSLTSRRRQNVGLTNISKDRINKVQTCNMQQFKRCQVHPSSNHKEEQKPSAGTITVHQNAEFLFS